MTPKTAAFPSSLGLPLALTLALTASAVAAPPATTDTSEAAVERRTANNGNVLLEAVPEVPEHIADALARYQNTRSAGFQDWDAAGEGIYVTTRFGDVTQLHHVARPGAMRRQLTFYGEPVRGADRRPEGEELAISMDEGGGEFFQIFLFDPATGERRRLTDGASRNAGALWSDDGKRLAYRSTRRNGRSNDVWMMDPAEPEAAKMILESPDGTNWDPAEYSPDGRRMLIEQYVSITDSRIHLLDLETGELELVAGGGDTQSANRSATFAAGGGAIFYVTDAGGDFRQLVHHELATGEVKLLTGDIRWDVGSFVLSDDGSRAAFDVNEGGTESLYLMDPATHETRKVEAIPVGLIFGFEFSPDDRALALTLNNPTTPSDVFTLELGDGPLDSGELVRWTASEVGGLDTASFVTPELIHYPTFDQVDGAAREIPAFVYKPRTAGPHPVIVSIHGGPEGQYRPSFSSTYQMWLAKLGVAVIAPNVRGSSGYGKEYVKLDNGFKREDSVQDIGALLDWIAAQPDLDASRVAVYGGSYGGYMVLACLTHYGDRIAAAVDIVGISNFVTFLENTQDYRRDLRRVEYGDERDPAMRAHLEKISPSNNAEKITTPLFVAQGQNDPRVPVTESEQVVAAVRAAGYDVWYMNALNEGHGFRKKENRDLYQQIVVMFFEEFLLGDPAP